jgi:hypothetical protein
MTKDAGQQELLDAIEAVLSEQDGARSYQHSQWRATRKGAEMLDRPRPLEFDKNGFPVRQRSPSFFTRVARLLNP